ncbi:MULTISPECIES: excalibur calcium-binding domain-containing protein [Streptomyces violaceoruber group]|uniref:Excalibur calcium-binding domain-containing protein n=1 Tax=Streptomyces rubrogriseus TaxID=194673 RepID=A0A6G3T7P3_9ACTN|nr:hypothetical protein [Streptomyces rubrogriseus]
MHADAGAPLDHSRYEGPVQARRAAQARYGDLYTRLDADGDGIGCDAG